MGKHLQTTWLELTFYQNAYAIKNTQMKAYDINRWTEK